MADPDPALDAAEVAFWDFMDYTVALCGEHGVQRVEDLPEHAERAWRERAVAGGYLVAKDAEE